MKRKPFLPDTYVQEVATPANKFWVVKHLIIDDASQYVVKDSSDVESQFTEAEIELTV